MKKRIWGFAFFSLACLASAIRGGGCQLLTIHDRAGG